MYLFCSPWAKRNVCVGPIEWLQMVFGTQTWHGAPLMSRAGCLYCGLPVLQEALTRGADTQHSSGSGRTTLLLLFLFLLHLALPSPSPASTSQLSAVFPLLHPHVSLLSKFAICILLMSARVRAVGSAECCLGRSYVSIEGMSDASP